MGDASEVTRSRCGVACRWPTRVSPRPRSDPSPSEQRSLLVLCASARTTHRLIAVPIDRAFVWSLSGTYRRASSWPDGPIGAMCVNASGRALCVWYSGTAEVLIQRLIDD